MEHQHTKGHFVPEMFYTIKDRYECLLNG